MLLRKIDAMYHYYGIGVGRCEDCPHFRKKIWDRTYHKCTVYGQSNSEATDWRKGYTACGLIDKPFPEDETRVVYRVLAVKENKPLDGQISIFEGGTS